ncbi:MAG: DUF4118 domain-containing protein [Gammaproteobacteria bacterium]|nr:DUF4118 domain-containing protein [Gammaproteobacteria bacterium]MDP2139913.1 DUF4118 domain-containing protein [Gammaproteobacteria bacterium]MDP2347733.1 DUF4118 domain-containing protein [Gammaproteobacteria bacterium]
MNANAIQKLRPYAFALSLTLVATLIDWFLQHALPASNLALIYMAAVIITSVYTATGPALLSAFSSFLVFNFFFTEPRGTFLISSREDALTAGFLVMIALLVGPLAARRTRLLTDLAQERMEKETELLRSSLLSSVSHDFRTPLTAMIGATTTLMEMGDTLSREQKRELLESVLSEAERLNNYTQNLLDMTRLGRGDLRLERSWVSIEEIINVTLKRIRPLAENHQLDVNMAPSLPLLRVHPALIEQAIFNVLHNSLKFSPAGSTVRLSCHESRTVPGRVLVVEISDEGPGIEVSERENVFRMFHTAEKGDRRVAGSGLGLAICKGMIGAHGGSVEIADAVHGTGCLVRISIPVADQNENSQVG